MAHFEDFSNVTYFPASNDLPFLAIGWLEPQKPYAHGDVISDFFARLCWLLQQPWQPPVASGGLHQCGFCRFSGGRGRSSFRSYHFDGVSGGALFVPSGDRLFVSPTSIAHYIGAHNYCPPSEFQEAVMACPEMRSTEYMRALLATPAKEWLRRLRIAAQQPGANNPFIQ